MPADSTPVPPSRPLAFVPYSPGFVVAQDRAEHEPCQRGTVGCCVDHGPGAEEVSCQTW